MLERLTEQNTPREETPHPGLQVAGWLKTGGCILVLVIFLLGMALLFTAGADPIKGYEPPESGEYYHEHIEELCAELEENVFPALPGVESWRVEGGKIFVTLSGEKYMAARSALLHYFPAELFEFIMPEG